MHPISDEIEHELPGIAREVEHLVVVLQRAVSGRVRERTPQEVWEITTLAASAVEKIYSGCERVMARLASQADGQSIAKVEGWHRALLERMRSPFHRRGAILSDSTHDVLDRMRAFRHRERNSYGFDLDTDVVLERAAEVIAAYHALAKDVRRFLAEGWSHDQTSHDGSPRLR